MRRPYGEYVNPRTFGTWLTSQRQARGLTQAELAHELSVNVYTVGDWEREARTPSLANLTSCATWAGVSLELVAALADAQLAGPPLEGGPAVHRDQLSIVDGGA